MTSPTSFSSCGNENSGLNGLKAAASGLVKAEGKTSSDYFTVNVCCRYLHSLGATAAWDGSNWDLYKPSTVVLVSFRAVGDARPYRVGLGLCVIASGRRGRRPLRCRLKRAEPHRRPGNGSDCDKHNLSTICKADFERSRT